MRIARKFADHIENTNNWEEISEETGCRRLKTLLKKHPERLRDLYFDAYSYLDDPVETAHLKAAGFDGAIHAGAGETHGEVEYKVFDESQIRSATTPWIGLESVVRRLVSEGIDEDEAVPSVETAIAEGADTVRTLRIDRVFIHVDDVEAAAEHAASIVKGHSPRI
jgi:hypothetical protein